MIEIVHEAFMSELRKIAAEGQETEVQNQTSDVDSEDQISPAVQEIFNMKELTRIQQQKDDRGKPSNSAHSSPIVTDREAAKKIHDIGKREGFQQAAKEGVRQAAAVGQKAYQRGYQNAARQGVEIAAQSYMKGRESKT